MICQIAVASLLLPAVCMAQGYTVTTVVGTGTTGFSGDGGAAVSAQIAGVLSVALDSSGNLYVPDQFNQRVRKVTTDGTISTVAGSGTAGYKRSHQQLFDDVSFHIGQPKVTAHVAVRQARVIEPQAIEHRRLQVVHMHCPRRKLTLIRL